MITVYKRNSRTLEITIKNNDGIGFDLTSCLLEFSVKQKETDDACLIYKSTDDVAQALILNPATNGVAEIYLLPEDTEELSAGNYVFDITVTTSSGDVFSVVLPDRFVVLNPVTKLLIITLKEDGYDPCIAEDIGKIVRDDDVNVGPLVKYDNDLRKWFLRDTNKHGSIASNSEVSVDGGIGSGVVV